MCPITRRRILALSQVLITTNYCSSDLLQGQSLDSSSKSPLLDVQGTVVDNVSRSFIKGATISIRPAVGGGAKTVTSDDKGGFQFRGMPPGRYLLSVHKDGFNDQFFGAKKPGVVGTLLDLNEKGSSGSIELGMTPLGVLTGRVSDSDGQPVMGGLVQAYLKTFAYGTSAFIAKGRVVATNDLGEYRISGLGPGTYFIGISFRSGPGSQAVGPAFCASYYPKGSQFSTASPIPLAPGSTVSGLDIIVGREETWTVRGLLVEASTMLPVSSASITAYRKDAFSLGPVASSIVQVASLEGAFEVPALPAGTYVLIVNQSGRRLSDLFEIVIGRSDVNLNLRLGRAAGLSVSSRVLKEREAETDGAFDFSSLRITLLPDMIPHGGLGPVALSKLGIASIGPLAPGSYRFFISGVPKGLTVVAARSRGKDLLRDGLTLVESMEVVLVEIEFSSVFVTISGIVKTSNGALSSGGLVSVQPLGNHRLDLHRRAIVAPDGTFSLVGLPAGMYRVYAWEDVELGATESDSYLASFSALSKTLDCREILSHSVELVAIAGNGLRV